MRAVPMGWAEPSWRQAQEGHLQVAEIIKMNRVTQEGAEFKERPRGHQDHQGDRGGLIRERWECVSQTQRSLREEELVDRVTCCRDGAGTGGFQVKLSHQWPQGESEKLRGWEQGAGYQSFREKKRWGFENMGEDPSLQSPWEKLKLVWLLRRS